MDRLKDWLERLAWTFVQALFGFIIVAQGFGQDVWEAALIAAGISAATLIARTATGLIGWESGLGPYGQLLVRSFFTFVSVALGAGAESGGFASDVWKAAAIAGGLAVAKCIVGFNVGKKDVPSIP